VRCAIGSSSEMGCCVKFAVGPGPGPPGRRPCPRPGLIPDSVNDGYAPTRIARLRFAGVERGESARWSAGETPRSPRARRRGTSPTGQGTTLPTPSVAVCLPGG
jgi:hypothetical protein